MEITDSLLSSLVHQESGGNPLAVGSKGELGLFQFMPSTARELGINPLDSAQAWAGAKSYLAQLNERFGGDPEKVLAAWNWGPGNVEKKGAAAAPSSTHDFVRNVMARAGMPQAAAAEMSGYERISDPSLLAKLNAKQEAGQPSTEYERVTDPALLAKLGGARPPQGKPTAPGEPIPLEYDTQHTPSEYALSALGGFGRGVEDIWRGLRQAGTQAAEKVGLARPGAAQAYTQAVEQAERNRLPLPVPTGEKIARTTGQIAPWLAIPGPGGKAGALAKLLYGAGVGGGIGAAQYVPPGQSRAANVIWGAALGGLPEALGMSAGAIKSLMTGRAGADVKAEMAAEKALGQFGKMVRGETGRVTVPEVTAHANALYSDPATAAEANAYYRETAGPMKIIRDAYNHAINPKTGEWDGGRFAAFLGKEKNAAKLKNMSPEYQELLTGAKKLAQHAARTHRLGLLPVGLGYLAGGAMGGGGVGAIWAIRNLFETSAGRRVLRLAADMEPSSRVFNHFYSVEVPKVLAAMGTSNLPEKRGPNGAE